MKENGSTSNWQPGTQEVNGEEIPKAAESLGIDAFCLYQEIILGELEPERDDSGKFLIRSEQLELFKNGGSQC